MSHPRVVSLPRPVPPELLADIEEKLRYSAEGLEAFRFDAGRPKEVEISCADGADGDAVAAKVVRLVEQMITGWRVVPVRVSHDHRDVRPTFDGDPWPAVLERGWAVDQGPGLVALGGPVLSLFHALDARFAAIAAEMGAPEVRYPDLIGRERLERCQYFSSFPHHVTFCGHLRGDLDVLEGFAGAQARGVPFDVGAHLAPPSHVLNPALCFHTWSSLAGVQLPAARRLTMVGRCFRWESSAMTRMERLWAFTMREIVCVGRPEEVRAFRAESLERVDALVSELGLQSFVETANDPFFVNNFVARKYHQLLTDAKFELRLTVHGPAQTVAAASFNLHESFFGRSYEITQDGAPAWTSCTAFGIERWVWAILCQYGTNPQDWPLGSPPHLPI